MARRSPPSLFWSVLFPWLSLLLLILAFFFWGALSVSAVWFYPLSRYPERSSYKDFAQYIDADFYTTSPQPELFPAHYTGYHTGQDLEIFSAELTSAVPVFAVSSGRITFRGPVSGYGGVIIQYLPEVDLTALYGHLDLSAVSLSVGQTVSAGTRLAHLGDAFSPSAGGERKHLHLGLYHGSASVFAGYTQSASQLDSLWVDPDSFLISRSATDPLISASPPSPSLIPPASAPATSSALSASSSLLSRLIHFITAWLLRLFAPLR